MLARDHIVCGDFNAHQASWRCRTTDARGRDFCDAISSEGLSALNSVDPTFIPPQRGLDWSVSSVTATGALVLPPMELATSADIRSLCEKDFYHTELEQVVFKRHKHSAPGPDEITHQMLRNLATFQHHFLLDAFNSVLGSAVLPHQWRSTTAIPVLKHGKPPHSVKSYRPIFFT
ncbi:hypothetical protein MRX96_020314 [Rhipicephalus microplus]